jgi:hypothetical protein
MLAATLSVPVIACKGGDGGGAELPEEDSYKITERAADFSYYPKTVMNEEGKLYVFGSGMDTQRLITAQAIQGLFAQDKVTFYLANDNPTRYWLEDLKNAYDITTENVDFEGMLGHYKAKLADDYGYILYDKASPQTVNVACTLSGITGWLPVDVSLADTVQAAGLTERLDVTARTERWCFDNYKAQLNNKYLVQQPGGNARLRDFGIANKLFFFYQDAVTTTAINFRGEIHAWAEGDAPIFGWGPGSEDSHVGIATMNSQFTIPSDHCVNMTVFGARDYYNITGFRQPNESAAITANPAKHYVSFIRSDGDNIQTWFGTFPFSTDDMAATRGNFPMGWSIQPSLTDIAPNIIADVYKTAKGGDYFVAAVSGMGYMYPNTFPRLADFVGSLDIYLKRADLNLVQILDSGPSQKVIEYYSRIPSLKGGIYAYGNKYIGGNGSVYWSANGKPFVSFRESLWDVSPEYMANRINSFPVNPSDISGYSLINLHPWSMTYNDVKATVSLLGENVQVVSPEQFFDLIIANVPKTNKLLTA